MSCGPDGAGPIIGAQSRSRPAPATCWSDRFGPCAGCGDGCFRPLSPETMRFQVAPFGRGGGVSLPRVSLPFGLRSPAVMFVEPFGLFSLWLQERLSAFHSTIGLKVFSKEEADRYPLSSTFSHHHMLHIIKSSGYFRAAVLRRFSRKNRNTSWSCSGMPSSRSW